MSVRRKGISLNGVDGFQSQILYGKIENTCSYLVLFVSEMQNGEIQISNGDEVEFHSQTAANIEQESKIGFSFISSEPSSRSGAIALTLHQVFDAVQQIFAASVKQIKKHSVLMLEYEARIS